MDEMNADQSTSESDECLSPTTRAAKRASRNERQREKQQRDSG